AALQAQHGASQPLVGGAAQPQLQQPAPTRAGEPMIRGAGGAPLTDGATAKAANVQTGYATKSARSMQLLEQARDSIFQQILMKLTAGGGEMRMRLSPPDLGQLDLRMTVEGGNKLTLLIGAERSDMAQLLQRHIEELKGALQENGLEVTGAEVQTRDDFERQQAADDDGAPAHHTDDIAEDADSAPRARGYITADGLDFWA
ncbi:MAG: flagellar hook-length control protein FliK, partial [Planctomycetota bacterium]